MHRIAPATYDDYIKALTDISCAITSDLYLEDLLKLIVMVTAKVTGVAILNTELMVKTKVIQEELETRKLIERAKEVLMQRKALKGDEAYRWLQKRSMDSRKSMRQVAEAVLLSEELDIG